MTRNGYAPSHLQARTPLREQYQKQQSVHGKREENRKPHKGSLVRMIVSAMLLAVVVGVKLTSPDVIETYRGKILELMGQDTDFVSAFSAVGQAIGEKDIKEVLNDAYVAVFGGEEMEETTQETVAPDRNAVVYDETNTPQQTAMFQQVLGFDYAAPVNGTLTSAFGYRDHPVEENERFHYGLDIAADSGEIIRAFADGKVSAVGESSDLGKYVELLHDNGYSTLYAHCSKITASSGQQVKLGDPIAEVGETGEATGPHLHFALCQDTLYLNPIYYVTL